MSDGISDGYRMEREANEWRQNNPERQALVDLLFDVDLEAREIRRDVETKPTEELERAMWRAEQLATRFQDISEKIRGLRADNKEIVHA